MKISIPQGKLPFLILDLGHFDSIRSLIDWATIVNTRKVRIVVLTDYSITNQQHLLYLNKLSSRGEIDVIRISRMDPSIISSIDIDTISPYYIYTTSNIIPIDDCPADLINHMIKAFRDYPDVHKVGSFIGNGNIKPIENKNYLFGEVGSEFALYKKNESDFKVRKGNIITKLPYRTTIYKNLKQHKKSIMSSPIEKVQKKLDMTYMAARSLLKNKVFIHTTSQGINTEIVFYSDTQCTGWNGCMGDVYLKGRRIKIKWRKLQHGSVVLDFDENFVAYKGLSTKHGRVKGIIKDTEFRPNLTNTQLQPAPPVVHPLIKSNRPNRPRPQFNTQHPAVLSAQVNIPNNCVAVVINNRDRLSCLQKQIDWLLKVNTTPIEIVIIDNDSTYKPLLEYYSRLQFNNDNIQIVKFSQNYGSRAITKLTINGGRNHYIYTDSDIIPKEDCPPDLIEHLISLSDKYPLIHKVGVSLEINDIPDHFPLKKEVIKHEASFKARRVEDGDAYKAGVDTTFAVYRKNYSSVHIIADNIRSIEPYLARHEPWYMNPDQFPSDFVYYALKCSSEASWIKQLKDKGIDFNYLVLDFDAFKDGPFYQVNNGPATKKICKYSTERTYSSVDLSILICSVDIRFNFLARLLYRLLPQVRNCEVLISVDCGARSIGQKRNELLENSLGNYVCFVDDDDLVSFDYVEKILSAITSKPDCCSMEGIMTTNGQNPHTFMHSKKYKGWYEGNGIYYRTPNHLCPVKRTIALNAKFPLISHGEDKVFSDTIRPHLKTESCIQGTIYYYLYRSK